MVDVTMLGCGGSFPLPERALASLCITSNGSNIIIDCGEGTQAAARRYGISLFKTDTILLTHFHGDHYFGLPGMLQTMASMGRTETVTIVGPLGLKEKMDLVFKLTGELPFKISVLELSEMIGSFECKCGCITAFPCNHTEPCCGYVYEFKRQGRFDADKAKEKGVPLEYWNILQKGECVDRFTPDMVLGDVRKGIKIVYAVDTAPCEEVCNAAKNADLFLMDSNYVSESDKEKARERGHSLCSEVGMTANTAGVKNLWLTHYSAKITDTENCVKAASEHFANTEAGFDGKKITFEFEN